MPMNLTSALLQSSVQQPKISRKQLSTGLSLLNLAMSGDWAYGVESGSVIWISGPSGSGRSTVGLTLLAEATQNIRFSDYRLVCNDTEAQNYNIAAYFGIKVAQRVELSKAATNEDFWNEIRSFRQPFIYLLDSVDGLQTADGWKVNNERAKKIFDFVKKMDSIMILTSQEKEVEEKKVAAGGFAIPFYADYCIRTADSGPLSRTIGKKERVVGQNTTLTPIKSAAGLHKIKAVPAPVFSGSGYDNAESLFMFLRRKNEITEVDGQFFFKYFDWKAKFDGMLRNIREYEQVIVSWVGAQYG